MLGVLCCAVGLGVRAGWCSRGELPAGAGSEQERATELAGALAPASAPAPAPAPAPASARAPAPAPASASAPASALRTSSQARAAPTCGDPPLPLCPLHAWMKANTEPAMNAQDFAALATALDTGAAFAPPSYQYCASIASDRA